MDLDIRQKTFILLTAFTLLLSACGGGGSGGGSTPSPTLSANANLNALSISIGSFNESFSANQTHYTIDVSVSVGSTTVIATPEVGNVSALTVNGMTVSAGTASNPISLNLGNNIILVAVVAENGTNSKTYTININALSDDANLNAITVSAGALNEAFAANQTNYTVDVDASVATTTVTATPADSDIATVSINNSNVATGAASGSINLAEGDNTVSVLVTAVDGTTTKTYTITITRAAIVNNHTPAFVVFRADKEIDEKYELYSVVDDGSASPIKLSGALQASGDVTDYAVSPDGTHVAYIANEVDKDNFDVFIVPVDGSTSAVWASHLLPNFYNPQAKSFAWSPDSTKVIFLGDFNTENADELYMVNKDGSDLHKINGTISTTVEIGDFSWSPDGNFVAYKVYNRNQPDAVIGINSHLVGTTSGQSGFSVRLNPLLLTGRSIKSFAWSSNSTQVAYLADQVTSGEDALFVSTANVSQVSTELSHNLDPGKHVTEFSWSFDGSNVAYLAEGATNNSLYTSTADAMTIGQLVSPALPGDVHSFRWSPSANQLAFMADTGVAYELFFSSADGSNIGRAMSGALTNAGDKFRSGTVMSFAWSPDGNRVAYRADQDSPDVYELYVSSADGTVVGDKVSSLLIATGDVLDFAWSPDSSRVAYRAAAEVAGVVVLYVSAVNGSASGLQVSQTNLPDHADIGVYQYTWATDSEALTYKAAQTTPGVIELYASLANGQIAGIQLSGTIISNGDISEENGPVGDNITELFTDDSWIVPFKNSEMCAMDYDPINDAIFIVKCLQVRTNKLLRYSFATKVLSQVYEFNSQLDYGMRLFGNDLLIAGSYREAILHLADLDKPMLTEVGNYFEGDNAQELNEINDLTLVDNDIYFVAGNFLTSIQHDGVQKIAAPNYDTVTEFISEADSGWGANNGQTRSIVSIGNGSAAQFYIAAGGTGDLERWDSSGDFLNAVPGFGDHYLQTDSQSRVYTVDANLGSASVTRWSSDLSIEETIPVTSSLDSGSYTRFAIKENASDISIYMLKFRSTDPRFDIITVPN